MNVFKVLLNQTNKHKVVASNTRDPRLWRLIQKSYCESRISWSEFEVLTTIMSRKGEFVLNENLEAFFNRQKST